MQILMWTLQYLWLAVVLLILTAGACGYSFRSELTRLVKSLNRPDRCHLLR